MVNRLDRVLRKQRNLQNEIDINGAKDDFESYFNNKMKTFYINE
jgi:hypothetical protein